MFGEREVEIEWLFKNLGNGSVLDIGSNEATYIKRLVDDGHEVTQNDIRPMGDSLDTKKVMGDVRKLVSMEMGKFDNVLVISTLEHIGLEAYGNKADYVDDPFAEQLRTFKHCFTFMLEGGRLLLTVPYGKREMGGWFLVYDREAMDKLKNGRMILGETYFALDKKKDIY